MKTKVIILSFPLGPEHVPVNPCPLPPRVRQILNTVTCDVLIHSHFSASQHVLDGSRKLVDLQEQQELPPQLVEHLDDIILPFSRMFQNNSLVSVGVQVKDIPVVGFELVSGLRCQHTAK